MKTAPTRQVVTAAFALLALGIAGAIQTGVAGSSFLHDLEEAQPPLAHATPFVDRAPTPRLARRVFVVIVDGLRLDTALELPFLATLRVQGTTSPAASMYPTWSIPNYVSILTGVPPAASGVRTNFHASRVELDSLMDRARAAKLRVAVASDYDALPRLFLRHRLAWASLLDDESEYRPFADPQSGDAIHAPDADLVSPFDEARYAPWPGGFREAGEALAAGQSDLVVLLVGAVDAAGHAHGAGSTQYREAALGADRALASILANVDLTRDAVIVTSDHGHTWRGGHGGVEPEVVAVPLFAAGAGIQPGSVAIGARLIDVAPTAAALLGVAAPGHGLGRTLTELLAVDAATKAAREATDHARLAYTLRVVAAADRAATDKISEHRTARTVVVLCGALLACGLAGLLIRRRVLHLDTRVLMVTLPTFFVTYFGMLGVAGQRWSPSFLPARGHVMLTLFEYGGVAVLALIAASMWAVRHWQTLGERLAAANGIALANLVLTLLPAGVLWAAFPAPYDVVPGPTWMVLIPAIEVAVACAATTIALTLFIEVAIFVARAWQRNAIRIE